MVIKVNFEFIKMFEALLLLCRVNYFLHDLKFHVSFLFSPLVERQSIMEHFIPHAYHIWIPFHNLCFNLVPAFILNSTNFI